MEGKEGEFTGLKALAEQWFELRKNRLKEGGDESEFEEAQVVYREALEEILAVAKGEVPTFATWMREFITQHPDYQGDNIITDKINYALNRITTQITDGTISTEKFYWKSK